MSKRAVLYARVSGDDRGKDGRNLAGQIEMGRQYALTHGYTIIDEISEDQRGARGAEMDLPGLTRALDLAHNGEFDVLVVRELDRFARRLAKQLVVEEQFQRAGVEIDYVLGEYPDTPEGNLNKNIRAVIAEFEATKISERMTRGRRRKVKGGSVIVSQRPPYGYRVAEHDGKRTLEIHEPEARVVRLIFQWYTGGDGENGLIGIREIARKLTAMGIPTSKKRKKWSTGSLAIILSNETYAGTWHYGKSKKVKGQKVKNPDTHLIAVEVAAIISRETWELAQRRRQQNRRNSPRNVKYQYLLRRRVKCGHCTTAMVGAARDNGSRLYYYCPATKDGLNYSHDCGLKAYFRVDQVDAVVWEWVRSFLADPAALQAGLDGYRAEQSRRNTPMRDRLVIVDDLIADNRTQLARLLDLYLAGDFDKEMLTERKSRLEATVKALEKERAALAAHLETKTLTEGQVQSIQEFAAKVGQGLGVADTSFEARRKLVDLLDVTARLAVEDGDKVIYVACNLGEGVLSVASKTIRCHRHNRQLSFILTARIVLPKPTRGKRGG